MIALIVSLLAILSITVAVLVWHHVWEAKRIDALVTGFTALEHIVRGAIAQRQNVEREIQDHEARLQKLEAWKRLGEGL